MISPYCHIGQILRCSFVPWSRPSFDPGCGRALRSSCCLCDVWWLGSLWLISDELWYHLMTGYLCTANTCCCLLACFFCQFVLWLCSVCFPFFSMCIFLYPFLMFPFEFVSYHKYLYTRAFIMILSGVPPALFACFLPLGLFVGQCSETKVPTSQREWTQFLGRTVRAWVGADALSRMKCDSYYLCMRWGVSGYRVQASSSITFSLRWNSLMHSMNQLGLDWPGVYLGWFFGSKQLLAISITRECSGQHSTSDDSETFSASQARQDRRGQFCAVLCAKDYAGLPKSWRSYGGGFCLDFLHLEAFWFQTLGAAKLEDLFHDHPL